MKRKVDKIFVIYIYIIFVINFTDTEIKSKLSKNIMNYIFNYIYNINNSFGYLI